MASDYWSHQERCIVSGVEFGFILASGTIAEGDMLQFSHSKTGAYGAQSGAMVDGNVVMEAGVALGDAVGVAQKAASDGDTIPVLFEGVQKMMIAGSDSTIVHKIFAGSLVINSTGATKIVSTLKGWGATVSPGNIWLTCVSHVLGMALQMGTDMDEILVLVGRTA